MTRCISSAYSRPWSKYISCHLFVPHTLLLSSLPLPRNLSPHISLLLIIRLHTHTHTHILTHRHFNTHTHFILSFFLWFGNLSFSLAWSSAWRMVYTHTYTHTQVNSLHIKSKKIWDWDINCEVGIIDKNSMPTLACDSKVQENSIVYVAKGSKKL